MINSKSQDIDGSVRDQSVLWFFCWAENGDGSAETAVACEDIFNEIFAYIRLYTTMCGITIINIAK